MTSALANIGITELFNDLGKKALDPSYTGDKNNKFSGKKEVKEDKDEEEREKGVKLEAGNKKHKKKNKFC